MEQNLQNTQNFHLGWAAHNRVAAGKRAGWQAFPNPAKKAVLKVLQVL